jgi:hypothetical protein
MLAMLLALLITQTVLLLCLAVGLAWGLSRIAREIREAGDLYSLILVRVISHSTPGFGEKKSSVRAGPGFGWKFGTGGSGSDLTETIPDGLTALLSYATTPQTHS